MLQRQPTKTPQIWVVTSKAELSLQAVHRSSPRVGQTQFSPHESTLAIPDDLPPFPPWAAMPPPSKISSERPEVTPQPPQNAMKCCRNASQPNATPRPPRNPLKFSKRHPTVPTPQLKARHYAAIRPTPPHLHLHSTITAPTSFSEPAPMCSSAMGLWGGAAVAGGAAGGGAGGLGGLRPRAELRYCRSCCRCAARMW